MLNYIFHLKKVFLICVNCLLSALLNDQGLTMVCYLDWNMLIICNNQKCHLTKCLKFNILFVMAKWFRINLQPFTDSGNSFTHFSLNLRAFSPDCRVHGSFLAFRIHSFSLHNYYFIVAFKHFAIPFTYWYVKKLISKMNCYCTFQKQNDK